MSWIGCLFLAIVCMGKSEGHNLFGRGRWKSRMKWSTALETQRRAKGIAYQAAEKPADFEVSLFRR
jgi:hypothetical protein